MSKAKKGPARKVSKKAKAQAKQQATKMVRRYEDKAIDLDGYPRASRRPVDTFYDA